MHRTQLERSHGGEAVRAQWLPADLAELLALKPERARPVSKPPALAALAVGAADA